MAIDSNAALVLFSGGQDSSTCLVWALSKFSRVETIGFNYGQRHSVEMKQRPVIIHKLCAALPGLKNRLGADTVLDVPTITQIGDTAMTSEVEIEMGSNGLPTTFVPARNLLFLTFAASLAYRRGIKHIITGVCETDYSGYPDCRDDTIKALQVALNLGMDTRLVLHTPLMFIDKAGTWELAFQIGEKHFPMGGVASIVGGDEVVDVIVEDSHSCYVGDRSHRHAWGYGCDACPACELRKQGWERWVAMRVKLRDET